MTHVLVVAAHPDDAELALGGTIAVWADQGLSVTVALCSVSENSAEMAERRQHAAAEAAKILGHRVAWLTGSDVRQVEQIPEYDLVGIVDEAVRTSRPDVVVTHWEGDSHADHTRVARAVSASSRLWPELALLQFGANEHRAPNYGGFAPDVLLPVDEHLERKSLALACYAYEGQGYRPLDGDGMALRSRALGSLVGLDAAEGLRLVRVVGGTTGARGLGAIIGLGARPDKEWTDEHGNLD